MKPMTQSVRDKISLYIKNKADISELIKDVDIRNERLDGAIIKNFNYPLKDISGASFVRCTLGEEGKVINLDHAKAVGCNFKYAKFLGKIDMRHIEARNCNFCRAFMPYADYRDGDFRGSIFCGTIFALSDWCGRGAKFDINIFENLFKHWGIRAGLNPNIKSTQEST